VREPDEVQNGMIPSAVSLPLREMKDALGGTGEGDFYEVSSESGPPSGRGDRADLVSP